MKRFSDVFDQALSDYLRRWPDSSGVVKRFQVLMRSWPTCLNRENMPGHLTASAWVTDPTGTEVLLTHHRKLSRWVQLGGHADGDGNLLVVAKTEAREESGATNLLPIAFSNSGGDSGWSIFDLDIHPIPPYGSVSAHLHFDVRFAFTSPIRIKPRVSNESIDVLWVKIKEIQEYSSEPSMLRMAQKWCGYRLDRDAE